MVHRKEQMQDTFRDIDLEHLKQKNIQSRELLQKFQEQLLRQRMLIRKSQQGLIVYKVFHIIQYTISLDGPCPIYLVLERFHKRAGGNKSA